MTLPRYDRIGFLIPGNYAEDDPFEGLETTLRLIVEGEALGYDDAWVRQRHLERGISSGATFLAAAGQRTKTIGLGTAVIPLGYENPFRLAEDLATADVLSRGRLNVGVSTGRPAFAALITELVDAAPGADYGHGRAERLRRAILGAPLTSEPLAGNAAGSQIPRVRPHAAGLADRLWYGGGSLASARWAGAAGWQFLTGNIVTGEGTDDFLTAQAALIRAFHAAGGQRVGLGRVILPTDSASFATRRRYADFVAARTARTQAPQGERRTLFLPDLVGSTEEILHRLAADPVASVAREFRLELPYEFEPEDYAQILADFARLLPALRDVVQKKAV